MRFKDTLDLFECAALIFAGEVVDDQAGDNSIKNGIRIRQGSSQSLIPLNISGTGLLAGNTLRSSLSHTLAQRHSRRRTR